MLTLVQTEDLAKGSRVPGLGKPCAQPGTNAKRAFTKTPLEAALKILSRAAFLETDFLKGLECGGDEASGIGAKNCPYPLTPHHPGCPAPHPIHSFCD